MKLLVDVGNTRTKAVLAVSDQLTNVDFSDDIFNRYAITQFNYASVRLAQHNETMVNAANKANVKVVEVQTQAQAFGVQCAYEQYQTLGIDRWLAVLGAAHQYPQRNVIVVDAGTATTVDFVTKDKRHLGGWIIPGLNLMTTAITSQTDKVFDDANTPYMYQVGTDTPAALKNGCLAAQLGIVRQAIEYFNRDAVLLIGGGTGQMMMDELKSLNPVYDEMLVFKGLALF